MTEHISPNVIELATRSGDGLEVALHWNRRSGSLWVDVLHLATGEMRDDRRGARQSTRCLLPPVRLLPRDGGVEQP